MKRLFIVITLLASVSCGSLIPAGKKSEEPGHPDRAELLSGLEQLYSREDYREVSEKGRSYLDSLSGTGMEGDIRMLVAKAEFRLGDTAGALAMADEIMEGDYPENIAAGAYLLKARVNLSEGRDREAVDNILYSTTIFDSETHLLEAERLLSRAEFDPTRDEIAELARRYRRSPLLRQLLEERYREVPEDRDLIGKLLEEDYTSDSLSVMPGDSSLRIGIIGPLSGKYAALGESFARGAYVALREGRKNGISNIEMIIGNTRASALEAQVVTGRLIREEKVDIILGGISNSSTVAAAQVAQANRTVIFSPASNLEGIEQIGDYVFQNTVDYELEVIAMARVAVRNLGIRRIAFLAPDSPFNRELELLFRREVEREGGLLCAADYYMEGSTDFKDNIDRIRKAAPEALFIPSDENDLVLIMPQLSFYEFGVQLLGLSMWDSSDLIYMSGRDMSGAVFPAQTREENDRALYLSAAAFVGEPVENVNHFEVRGYVGMREIINVIQAGGEGTTIRDRMHRALKNRVHPFVRAAAGDGIMINIIRDGRKEEFITYKFPGPRRR
ncbi:MAG: ABC transporter substrate-binding protein [Candidatus Krumholzibacteriales bacterium]